ncbi:MAG: RNA polymerase sigma factor [Planctomycetota bacterium]
MVEAEAARSGPALDARLHARALDGDEQAFRALYERFAPMVHAVLVTRAPRGEADDLMQDVFLAAWRALHQVRDGEHVGAWLAAMARHAAQRGCERARRRLETPIESEPMDPRRGADGRLDVLAVLRGLPVAYRETLAMRLVEGLSGPQIAEATGLTHGSVRVNLSRGMKLLQAALREKGWP